MKKFFAFLLTVSILAMLLSLNVTAAAAPVFFDDSDDETIDDISVFAESIPAVNPGEITVSAPSAILMEKETGTVLFEKDADTKREPASVTKVMTILLIVEALNGGAITLDDMVPTSTYAASMGGSQVYLEEGERMSVRDMLKAIVVSSANDAAVAMAEYLSGSEQVFVIKMNERAAELGMTNTKFTNCTGLMDDATHVTTARDIAIMSRELIQHDMIKEFTTIWMDTIRGGEFGLSNTNKLVRFYDGATGLKTGFTRRSMYCLSATAQRGGVEYIAVVMHSETSADRFESAKTLLSYAFANFTTITAAPDEALAPIPVVLGKVSTVQPVIKSDGKLLIRKNEASAITKTVDITEKAVAPVKEGDMLGTLTIKSGEEVLGEYPVVAGDSVDKLGWGNVFIGLLRMFFTGE